MHTHTHSGILIDVFFVLLQGYLDRRGHASDAPQRDLQLPGRLLQRADHHHQAKGRLCLLVPR